MPRKGGGGLIGILGKGVGLAAEYHEHRKGQKLSRENSEQDTSAVAGPSTRPQPLHASASSPADLPPSYSNVADETTERSLGSGEAPSDDKKAALAQYDENSSSSDDNLIEVENDEDIWQLDEAGERSNPPSYDESEQKAAPAPVDDLVQQVVNKNKIALYKTPEFERTPLPLPVILPQRRPGKKDRGFVRAYAPLLGECSGIDQETFLTFIENFEKASQASAIFPIIQVSAAIAGLAPSVIAMAVTTVVQIGAQAGEEVQSRYRTNSFLDKMNEALFKPAGLFAMIVKYKSEQEVAQSGNSLLARFGVSGEKVDFNTSQVIAKYDRSLSGENAEGRSMSDRMKNIRLASSETKGAAMIPEPAPLIWPDIDKAVAREGPETFKDKTKDAKNFIGDYMDRRAQMKYAQNDPNSALVVPESQRAFKSKLSDPNHPMFNGGIIGFVSGGALSRGRGGNSSRQDRRQERRFEREERRAGKRNRRYDGMMAEDDYYGREAQQYGYGGQRGMYDANYGRRSRGGLIGGLISAATNAGQSKEYEDSYSGRLAPAPYGGEERYGRRSFDERSYGPARPAPYGGEERYARRSFDGRDNAPAPHAPYGGQQPYDDRMPYGERPLDERTPYDERTYGFQSAGAGYASYGGRDQYPTRDTRRSRQKKGGLIGGAKKMMGSNVLYLMIVNMPSQAELAEAREALAAAKSER